MEKDCEMNENAELNGEEVRHEKAGDTERGVIIAPFGRFDDKALAARKIRKIMGID